MFKSLARRSLGHVPFKHQIVTRGALLPPERKGYRTSRALSIVKQSGSPDHALLTNLGMTRNLRVSLPGDLPDVYFFGRPEHYKGEEGAQYSFGDAGVDYEKWRVVRGGI